MNKREAYAMLSKLKTGDKVLVKQPGSEPSEMTVQQEIRRMDGNGFGSWDFASVTVGYGPGRYNFEVNAAGIEFGSYQVAPV